MAETTDPPPTKRLHATIEVDAHDLADLVRIIDRISLDLEIERREERHVISGDGFYRVEIRNSEPYTVDEYNDALLAWHERLVAERRGES